MQPTKKNNRKLIKHVEGNTKPIHQKGHQQRSKHYSSSPKKKNTEKLQRQLIFQIPIVTNICNLVNDAAVNADKTRADAGLNSCPTNAMDTRRNPRIQSKLFRINIDRFLKYNAGIIGRRGIGDCFSGGIRTSPDDEFWYRSMGTSEEGFCRGN